MFPTNAASAAGGVSLTFGLAMAAGAIALVIVVAVVAVVVARSALRIARPEDLPEVLRGLGRVFSALANFLPWRGSSPTGAPTTSAPPDGGAPSPPPAPPVIVVAGEVVRDHRSPETALPNTTERAGS